MSRSSFGSASPAGASSATDETDWEARERDIQSSRIVKDVVFPPVYHLSKEKLFSGPGGKPNIQVLKEHLVREGRVSIDAAIQLVQQCSALFKSEPNLLELKYPITVCGDIHGQFFDLMRLFEVGGDPKDTQFLFLGDYVDRGCFSTECVFYLYALKLVYPKSFFMLRGNHECRQLTSFFNFKDECLFKYNQQIYDEIMLSFDNLPLAALINKAFFCVHGGLSPDITSLEEIKSMDRFQEIPREGPMCDLLWSDPYEEGETNTLEANPDAKGESGKKEQEGTAWFGYNETRQCSYVYGIEAVKQFLKDNKLTALIRAHEAQIDGYKMQMINKASGIPRVITIFSAPNYCDVYKNKAACLKFDNNVLNIKQFIDSPHPYYLPNFMDVFQWSLPFVAEKVTDMLANVLESSDDGKDEEEVGDDKTALEKRGGTLKKKVLAVSRLLRTYKFLRQESEAILQLKQLIPSRKIPQGLLQKGSAGIAEAISSYENAKKADAANERRPSLPNAQSNIPTQPTKFKPTKFKVTSSSTSTAADENIKPSPLLIRKDSADKTTAPPPVVTVSAATAAATAAKVAAAKANTNTTTNTATATSAKSAPKK